jgi:hypothetical protein
MMIILRQRYGINLLLMRNCTLLIADCVCERLVTSSASSLMIIIALMRESEYVCVLCARRHAVYVFGSPSALHAWCFAGINIYTQPRRVSQYLDSCSLIYKARVQMPDAIVILCAHSFFSKKQQPAERSVQTDNRAAAFVITAQEYTRLTIIFLLSHQKAKTAEFIIYTNLKSH